MNKDMRIAVTKRMLKEGMLRCLESKTLSKITVSDLCRESGVNRATFYNHYETPTAILREMAREYAEQLSIIYDDNSQKQDSSDESVLEACLEYIAARKSEIRILFSENAEHCLSGFGMEIVEERAVRTHLTISGHEKEADAFLCSVTVASAVYGLIEAWLTMDIDKSPSELVNILRQTIRVSATLH